MDVLHHNLEAIEALGFRDLDFTTETLNEILIDNAIRRGKECKNMRDEVALILGQAIVPIILILGKVNLFSSPEGSLSLLVELPDLKE